MAGPHPGGGTPRDEDARSGSARRERVGASGSAPDAVERSAQLKETAAGRQAPGPARRPGRLVRRRERGVGASRTSGGRAAARAATQGHAQWDQPLKAPHGAELPRSANRERGQDLEREADRSGGSDALAPCRAKVGCRCRSRQRDARRTDDDVEQKQGGSAARPAGWLVRIDADGRSALEPRPVCSEGSAPPPLTGVVAADAPDGMGSSCGS